MTVVSQLTTKVLVEQITPHLEKMLASSISGSGDLAVTESAVSSALTAIRSLMVGAALQVSAQSIHTSWACPSCKKGLTAWASCQRGVVTSSGEGLLPVTRYRCRRCGKDFYPLAALNDLCDTQFTIGARELIATEAADAAFAQAACRLDRLGIPVSASEVERISDSVGQLRKEEEELVRVHLHTRNRDLPLPLYSWAAWAPVAKNASHAIVTMDGAMVRSDQLGPKGLEWFEVRSALLTLPGSNMPRAQIAGDISPDALFEGIRSIWRQSPVQNLPLVFVADGAEWIWERIRFFLPKAIQVLDIYHAGEHVASAARAAWGENDPRTRRWVANAIDMLVEQGPRSIIRQLIGALRDRDVLDRDELIRNLRYLWRHRSRMKYQYWRQQGITIGSGTMESRIKQVTTMRLRRPGMMWTKPGADLMLRLRAASLSGGLPLTIQRLRQIARNRTYEYKIAI